MFFVGRVTDVRVVPDRREVTLSWEHPYNLTDDGTFDFYEVECTAEDINNTAIPNTLHTAGWDDAEAFIVGPLTPFRNYTCWVTAVTVSNGRNDPVGITVETLQDSELIHNVIIVGY